MVFVNGLTVNFKSFVPLSRLVPVELVPVPLVLVPPVVLFVVVPPVEFVDVAPAAPAGTLATTRAVKLT